MVATVPVHHRFSMQLHTLLGMKAGDMASHLIHCIGIWSYVAASSSDRSDIALFIDAASYFIWYEGKSSCAFICISVWFKGWMRWSILRYIMNSYISYCTTTYRTLDKLYVAVWIFGYWFDVVASKLRWEVILFPSEVSYGMAKGIVEILYAFPSLH